MGVKEGGKYIYRENRTFGKQAHAKTLGANRVAELEVNGVPNINDVTGMTVGQLLKRYIADPNLGGKAGRTKAYVLNMLVDCEIAAIKLADLQTNHVIEHCRHRAGAGAGPSTVGHDLSYLSSVLAAAKPIFGIDYTDNPVIIARPILINMGLVGKSQRRSRRPLATEIERLIEGLRIRSANAGAKIPYEEILNFSILSCMRIGEVCRIRWEDIDDKQKSVLVRDRKDPRKKSGNHMQVPLIGEAWDIVQRQPKTETYIFPYNSNSVTAGFQRVRNDLGIEDLRYHDLRREGASRLFEAGFSIEEVAQVTLQCSINKLTIHTSQQTISLTEGQKRLLVALLKGINCKRKIINLVWYENHQRISDNNYHQLIFQLRALLKRYSISGDLIITIPHYGIKLNDSLMGISYLQSGINKEQQEENADDMASKRNMNSALTRIYNIGRSLFTS